MVCQSSAAWRRPSEEEQAQEIWYGPRYSGAPNWDLANFRTIFYEDFFRWLGGNSELQDHWRLRGLWTAAHDWSPGDPACADGRRVGSEVISVYLLLYEARSVALSGNTFYITVEKGPAGFQEIQFANLLFPAQAQPTVEYTVMKEDATEPYPVAKEGPPINYNIAVVDMNGRELARAEGGLRFERPTEGSPVATAAQAPTAGAEITK